MNISNIGLGSLRSSILVDLNCFIDQEVGLMRLIAKEYMNPDVFIEEEVNKGIIHTINKLYMRSSLNPLVPFAKPDISEDILDQYYSQFIERRKKDILLLSPVTDMRSFLELIKTEGIVDITILCNDDLEYVFANKVSQLNRYKKIKADDIEDVSKYYQLYFKFMRDIQDKYIYDCRTYYISTHRTNFNEDETFKEKEISDKIILSNSEISIIDLYNMGLLKEDNKENVEEND